MKKIYLLLTAALLAVNLCGCGVLEELSAYLDTRPTEPERELGSVLAALEDAPGGYSLCVHTKDGGLYGPYDLPALPELGHARGRSVEDPMGLGRYDHWMTVVSKDGSTTLTVYVGEQDLFCLDRNGRQEYYQDSEGTITRTLRQCFDRIEYEAAQLRVEPVFPGADGALREFASAAYPEMRRNLAPGSIYGFRDYDLMEYTLDESTETTLSGTIVYAALPDSEDNAILDQGELLDEAPYEGYVLITETVHLQLRDDGFWYRVDPVQ